MALDESDFLSWYNNEISRYRDHEWRLTSYSIALSAGIVLFANGAETSMLIAPRAATVAILGFVTVLIIAEFHTHARLNEYRERRTLLLTGGNHRVDKVRVHLVMDVFDAIYFCGFICFPAAFGVAAALTLLKN